MMKLIENEIELMNSASHPCSESFYLLAQITRDIRIQNEIQTQIPRIDRLFPLSQSLYILTGKWKTLIGQELIPFQFGEQKIQQSVVQSTVHEG